jgi:putative transposase
MACGDTPETVTRCQKIRLHPTARQATILRGWMLAARKTYNLALRLVKDKKAKPNLTLKKLVVTSRKEDNKAVMKMKQTPANIRVRAVLDLIDAYKTAWAGHQERIRRVRVSKSRWAKTSKQDKVKLKRRRWKTRPVFNVRYKSRRLTSDSFGFEPKSIKTQGRNLFLFSSQAKFGMKEPISMSEPVAHEISSCCRVQCVFGRWYLLVPFTTAVQRDDTSRIVALDPGVRSFMTYYSEDAAGEIGTGGENVMDKIIHKTDAIGARLNQLIKEGAPRQKISHLTKSWYRCHARASNLVTDLHYKTIKHLLDEHDVVIAPRLGVQWMVGHNSNLTPLVKKRLLFLRHGQFRRRLVEKAQQRGKVVRDLEEHGTSLTCSSCGNKMDKKDLGSSKTYNCVLCGLRMDRDLNASKNHLLKFLYGTDAY